MPELDIFWQKAWKFQKEFVSLQRERWNQVEPRCAERWHGRSFCGDDDQFDLAAWFHKHSDRYSIKSNGRFLSKSM